MNFLLEFFKYGLVILLKVSTIIDVSFLITNCSPPFMKKKEIVEAGGQSDSGLKADSNSNSNSNSDPSNSGSGSGSTSGSGPNNPPNVAPNPPAAVTGKGTAKAAGEAPGCNATPGVICEGGWQSDANPRNLPVKVIFGNPPGGGMLVPNPVQFARDFVESVNENYVYQGHRYLNLVLDEKKVMVVDQKPDMDMVQKYGEKGYYNVFLVASIAGPTIGYIKYLCADLSVTPIKSYIFFEIAFVATKLVSHELQHSFCLIHTVTENSNFLSFFKPGYNLVKDVIKPLGPYTKPFNSSVKIFVDPTNSSTTKATHDGMVFATANLMYKNVLTPLPKLFTKDGLGYPYSYSNILDTFYWENVKKDAAIIP